MPCNEWVYYHTGPYARTMVNGFNQTTFRLSCCFIQTTTAIELFPGFVPRLPSFIFSRCGHFTSIERLSFYVCLSFVTLLYLGLSVCVSGSVSVVWLSAVCVCVSVRVCVRLFVWLWLSVSVCVYDNCLISYLTENGH